MSLMPMMAATGSQAAIPNTVGAQDSAGSGNLEQMFAQLMQQIQAAMEQPISGSELPLDGESLPSDLVAQLGDFSEQLGTELSSEQLQQLDELVAQLANEGLPQDQIEQLAQAALLMQGAQHEKQDESDSLLQLVETIRATSAEGSDRNDQDNKGRSIDELLSLADRLRGVAESVSRGGDLPDQAIAGAAQAGDNATSNNANANANTERMAADLVGSSIEEVLPGGSGVTASQSASVAVTSASADDVSGDEAQAPIVDVIAAGGQQAVVGGVKEPIVEKVVPFVTPAPSSPAPANQGGEQAVKPGVGDAPSVAAGQQGAADQDAEQQGRRESLSRWVELRDSVAAQGQRLAQNDTLFKGALVAQSGSTTAEAGSLAQAGRTGSLAQLQQTYQTSATNNLALGVGERFGGDSWTPAASQRILWMAGQNISTAELRLDPPELGSLSVRLRIQGDQASLSFTSPHAHVREVLDQQMPRLREMLAENGIELGQADVSDQSLAKGSGEGDSADSQGGSAGEDIDPENQQDGVLAQTSMSLSLVDYYA